MKTILFNNNLSIVFESIRISLFSGETGDYLYQISNVYQSFNDESVVAFHTYGVKDDKLIWESFTEELLKNMASSMINTLPEDLVKEITNIENSHLMIIDDDNDSLQIHFNDGTITCILHLTGQY